MAMALGRPEEIVEALGSIGIKVRKPSASSVRRKRLGKRSTHEQLLADLREVVDVLSDSLTQRGVAQWLQAENRLLDGERPLDVLAKCETDRVLAAANSFVSGAYI